MHVLLFNIEIGERLSSQFAIDPLRALLVPSLGRPITEVWRFWCCSEFGRRAKSTRSRPTPYTAAGCRFAAA